MNNEYEIDFLMYRRNHGSVHSGVFKINSLYQNNNSTPQLCVFNLTFEVMSMHTNPNSIIFSDKERSFVVEFKLVKKIIIRNNSKMIIEYGDNNTVVVDVLC